MKSTIYLLVIAVGILMAIACCDDMNSVSKEFYDRGEMIYTVMPDSLFATPGYNKVRIDVKLPTDKRITKAIVYWDEQRDSAVIDVTSTPSKQSVVKELPEGVYLMEAMTKDNYGHRSRSLNVTVEVYGDTYISNLRNRGVQTVKTEATGATITWYAIETTSIQYATVEYSDYTNAASPVKRTVQVSNDATTTFLSGAKSGERYTIVTRFHPEGGLDAVDALPKSFVFP